jgi:hypothetical protein
MLSRSSPSRLPAFGFIFFAPLRAFRAPKPFALFAIPLLLAACGAAPAPLREEQVVDGVVVGLQASASPPLNASQELIVTLADGEGRPIDDADVYLDLTMPAMPMGTNRPEAEPQGQGRYRARTAYTMAGEWEITVVVEMGGAERRARFTRTVSE